MAGLLIIIALVNFVVALVLLLMSGKVMCWYSCWCDTGEPQVPQQQVTQQQVTQQQVMYNAAYAPGHPLIVSNRYPPPSYAPSFDQMGKPSYNPQQQWVQPSTSMGAAGAQAHPPAYEERSGPPPPSYGELFAASAPPMQQM